MHLLPWWIRWYPGSCNNDKSESLEVHVSCRQIAPKYRPWDERLKDWKIIMCGMNGMCPFPSLNGVTGEFWEWVSNNVPNFTWLVVTYPCGFKLTHDRQRYFHSITCSWKYLQAGCFLRPTVYELTLCSMRSRQNRYHFADDICKCIYSIETYAFRLKCHWIVPKDSIENIPTQRAASRRPSEKSLSESMMVSLLMYICVNRP